MLVNGAGYVVIPVLFSLCLPVFLYNIVLEKESRLIQNMKINGLQMKNYWIVNSVFNFTTYLITSTSSFYFGKYVLGLIVFHETNMKFFCILIFGWGLNQVSLAFLFSVFFQSSQAASMVGYTYAIFSSVVTSTLLMTNSCFTKVGLDLVLKPILHFYPTFPFNRVVHILVDSCSFDKCISKFSFVTDEMWGCLYAVYFDAIIWLVVAMYLEEVIP